VLHLDYVSCLLTVVSTVMVARKHWMGLVIASINSVIVGVIGLHTSQYGLILANFFCIMAYAWSVQNWRRDRKPALVTAAAPAVRNATPHPQPRARAILPSRKVRTGLFLAYSASSHARVEHQAANGLMNSGSAAEANIGN